MVLPKSGVADFVEGWNAVGPERLAKRLDISARQVFRRRRYLETQGYEFSGPADRADRVKPERFPGRRCIDIRNGIVVVWGDSHYWPGEPTLMHRALVLMLNRFREKKILRAAVANGDVTDFASISRWPQVDWEKPPTVQEEMEVSIDRMDEIARAAGRVPKFWPLGNHDARWSMFLHQNAKEFRGVKGFHLKDSFPLWDPCWSVRINDDIPKGKTHIQHQGSSSGKHSTKLNVERAGCHIITNHTHDGRVTPHNDFRPYTLWGVNTGCIANPYGAQFLYLEDRVRDWREGFVVLTFDKDGLLMQPELVLKWDANHVQFRGAVIRP